MFDMSEVVIVGGGGREYELARSIGLSDEVDRIYCDTDNAGIAQLPKVEISNWPPTVYKAETLVVIGPEAPLVDGLADDIRGNGGLVYGPSAEAAKLESSKAHATRFMQDNDI